MNKTSIVQVPVRDETGQKHSVLRVRGFAVWEEVTNRAADSLDLPVFITPEEPAVYHAFNDRTGEALDPSVSVVETIEQVGEIFRVLIAPEMNPAGGTYGQRN